MTKPKKTKKIELPPELQPLASKAGAHRKYLKALYFGPAKAGKSYNLAHFPRPLLAIDCGEGGIQPYLTANDTCLTAEHPQEFLDVLEWAFNNEDHFESVVIDPYTASWSDWMEYWREKLEKQRKPGVEEKRRLRDMLDDDLKKEFKPQDWPAIKKAWKGAARLLMRARFHVGAAAWERSTQFKKPTVDDEKETPGLRASDEEGGGKIIIRTVETPDVEKSLPHIFDLAFHVDYEHDRKDRPTGLYKVRFYFGRIPPSCRGELFIGKEWEFDTRDGEIPPDPWSYIIEPLLPHWKVGAVEQLGADRPEHVRKVLHEIDEAGKDHDYGLAMRLIRDASYESMQDYEKAWKDNNLERLVSLLDKKQRAEVMAAHEKTKEGLQ